MRVVIGFFGRRASRVLPRPMVRWMERIRGRPYAAAQVEAVDPYVSPDRRRADR